MVKIIYEFEEIKELLNTKEYREIKFDIDDLENYTSKIDFIGFGIRIKLELIYIKNKFDFKYSEENQLILQIRNIDETLIDTQIIQPWKNLLYIVQSSTNNYENYILVAIPNSKDSFMYDRITIDTVKYFSFMVIKDE